MIDKETQEQQELDAELNEVRDDHRQRCDEPWEVNLTKYTSVGGEGSGGLGQAGGEVVPGRGAGEVEQHGRQSIRGDLGHAAEDDGEHQGGEEWLNEEPERPEDGLLVDRHKVAPNKHPQQITIAPQIVQMQVEPAIFGADDEIPFVIGWVKHVSASPGCDLLVRFQDFNN